MWNEVLAKQAGRNQTKDKNSRLNKLNHAILCKTKWNQTEWMLGSLTKLVVKEII